MIKKELTDAFKNCDVLITPSYPVPALKLGESASDRLGIYASDICTVPANIAGIPAINVPCGTNSKGMPIGMQLMGKPFSEQLLFNTAFAYERLTSSAFTGGAFR